MGLVSDSSRTSNVSPSIQKEFSYLRAPSDFVIPSSFVIRVSSFLLRSPHPGNLRQRKHTRGNFGRVAIFDLIDRDRVRDIESPRFHSSERIEMGAATEFRADVVCVGSNVKTFAAEDGEIHFG